MVGQLRNLLAQIVNQIRRGVNVSADEMGLLRQAARETGWEPALHEQLAHEQRNEREHEQ